MTGSLAASLWLTFVIVPDLGRGLDSPLGQEFVESAPVAWCEARTQLSRECAVFSETKRVMLAPEGYDTVIQTLRKTQFVDGGFRIVNSESEVEGEVRRSLVAANPEYGFKLSSQSQGNCVEWTLHRYEELSEPLGEFRPEDLGAPGTGTTLSDNSPPSKDLRHLFVRDERLQFYNGPIEHFFATRADSLYGFRERIDPNVGRIVEINVAIRWPSKLRRQPESYSAFAHGKLELLPDKQWTLHGYHIEIRQTGREPKITKCKLKTDFRSADGVFPSSLTRTTLSDRGIRLIENVLFRNLTDQEIETARAMTDLSWVGRPESTRFSR